VLSQKTILAETRERTRENVVEREISGGVDDDWTPIEFEGGE